MLIGGEVQQPRDNLLLKPRMAELNLFDDELKRVFKTKTKKTRIIPASLIPEKKMKTQTTTTNMFLKLNNLIKNDKQIDAFKKYLETENKLTIKPKPTKTFVQNSELFYLKDGSLFVKEWNQEVLKQADKQSKLKLLYEENNFGLGISILKLYKHARKYYLGLM